jgi:hypothetical protein
MEYLYAAILSVFGFSSTFEQNPVEIEKQISILVQSWREAALHVIKAREAISQSDKDLAEEPIFIFTKCNQADLDRVSGTLRADLLADLKVKLNQLKSSDKAAVANCIELLPFKAVFSETPVWEYFVSVFAMVVPQQELLLLEDELETKFPNQGYRQKFEKLHHNLNQYRAKLTVDLMKKLNLSSNCPDMQLEELKQNFNATLGALCATREQISFQQRKEAQSIFGVVLEQVQQDLALSKCPTCPAGGISVSEMPNYLKIMIDYMSDPDPNRQFINPRVEEQKRIHFGTNIWNYVVAIFEKSLMDLTVDNKLKKMRNEYQESCEDFFLAFEYDLQAYEEAAEKSLRDRLGLPLSDL